MIHENTDADLDYVNLQLQIENGVIYCGYILTDTYYLKCFELKEGNLQEIELIENSFKFEEAYTNFDIIGKDIIFSLIQFVDEHKNIIIRKISNFEDLEIVGIINSDSNFISQKVDNNNLYLLESGNNYYKINLETSESEDNYLVNSNIYSRFLLFEDDVIYVGLRLENSLLKKVLMSIMKY